MPIELLWRAAEEMTGKPRGEIMDAPIDPREELKRLGRLAMPMKDPQTGRTSKDPKELPHLFHDFEQVYRGAIDRLPYSP